MRTARDQMYCAYESDITIANPGKGIWSMNKQSSSIAYREIPFLVLNGKRAKQIGLLHAKSDCGKSNWLRASPGTTKDCSCGKYH